MHVVGPRGGTCGHHIYQIYASYLHVRHTRCRVKFQQLRLHNGVELGRGGVEGEPLDAGLDRRPQEVGVGVGGVGVGGGPESATSGAWREGSIR